MLVVPEDGSLLLITQGDHAHLARDIVSLWRADGLPGNPRRPSILLAAREHDNGWREADAAPRVDPASGRPYGFRQLPRAERVEIWLRGTGRSTGDPYADLLVLAHARAIHADRREKPEWQDFFAELDERFDALAETVDGSTVAADYRFLEIADAISLAACERPAATWSSAGTTIATSASTVRLEPFPLAGSTTFRVRGRRIPDRPYAGDAELTGELAAARWEELAVRLSPPPEGVLTSRA